MATMGAIEKPIDLRVNKYEFMGSPGDLFELTSSYWNNADKDDPVSELQYGDVICYVGKEYKNWCYVYKFAWPNGRICSVTSLCGFIRSFFLAFTKLDT